MVSVNINVTNALQLSHNSLVRRLALIELCVLLTAVAIAVLIICGTARSRRRSWTFQITVWVAYILSTQILTYTIGMMHTAQFRNELFAIWAMLLLLLYGSSDSFSAFSLEDNEQWGKYTTEVLFLCFTVGSLVGLYATASHFKLLIGLLYIWLLYKVNERDQAFRLACKSSLAKNTKLIADFIAHEHEYSVEDEQDPIYMRRYNYLVAGDDETMATVKPPLYHHRLVITDEVITIKKIWRCQGRFLTPIGDPENKLKDICLSFALYKLLSRRFGGYDFAESTLEKTWNFVRYGLLSREEDYEREFRVIEVELSFLFDLFYAKHAVIFRGGRRLSASRVADLLFLTIACVVGVDLLTNYKPSDDYLNLFTATGSVNVDKVVTGVVIIGICIMEITQFILIMISNWSKVIWICRYVRNESWQKNKCFELFLKTICYRRASKPWERKLGQYSLLGSFNHKPNRIRHTISWVTVDVIHLPRVGQKESPSIALPAVVTKAVILSLRNNGPRLSNGKISLRQNQVWNELSWACELPTTIHVIIIWHIGTSLCRIELADRALKVGRDNFMVATALSDYCAYLLVFAPRLLPGHAAVTDFMFDRVVNEAGELLNGCKLESEMYASLMNLCGETVEEEAKLIERGALLAKHLIEHIQDDCLRWKVLADFWAELMLFLAPSDDARAHAEHLAKGGEFITHLWALLSHAGVLTQDQTQTSVV